MRLNLSRSFWARVVIAAEGSGVHVRRVWCDTASSLSLSSRFNNHTEGTVHPKNTKFCQLLLNMCWWKVRGSFIVHISGASQQKSVAAFSCSNWRVDELCEATSIVFSCSAFWNTSPSAVQVNACSSVLPWSPRNVSWSTKLPLTVHQHSGWVGNNRTFIVGWNVPLTKHETYIVQCHRVQGSVRALRTEGVQTFYPGEPELKHRLCF